MPRRRCAPHTFALFEAECVRVLSLSVWQALQLLWVLLLSLYWACKMGVKVTALLGRRSVRQRLELLLVQHTPSLFELTQGTS